MVLLVALAGVGISMIFSISSMRAIRNLSVESSEVLGQTAAGTSEAALTAQMEKNLQDLAVHQASEKGDVLLKTYLDFVKQCASYVSWIYESQELDSENLSGERGILDELKPVFEPVYDANRDMLARIYLVRDTGFLYSYDGVWEYIDAEQYDPRNADWYTQAKKQNAALYSGAYQDALGKGMMTTASAPVYDADGTWAGVACIDISLETFYQDILDIDISENAVAAILDAEGNLIAGPKVDFTGASSRTVWDLETAHQYRELAMKVLAGETGIGLANDMYFAYAPIELLDWRLIIRVPRADIVAPVMQMMQEIGQETQKASMQIGLQISSAVTGMQLLLAVTFLSVIGLAVRLTARIVKPIGELQKQVGVIRQGNLDARVKVEANDEIGALAQEFNAMTVSLKEQMEQVQRVTAEKERIDAELNVAAQIQASMLPRNFDAFSAHPEFEIFASMDPAKEVGGDFYDCFLVDEDHLAVVAADVSGKGVPAALFMVIAKTLIKDLAQMGLSPDEVFRQANEKLCESNEEDMFVTAWLGVLDIRTGHMNYVNAGHNPPLLYRAGKEFAYLKQKPGFVLAGMEGMRYSCGEIDLGEQDTLYLYTDGVTEATGPEEELYGEERLLHVLNEAVGGGVVSVKQLLHLVKEDLQAFVKDVPQSDDITMLGLKILKCESKTLTVPAVLENLDQVQNFVEEVLVKACCPDKERMQAAMAVEEIFVNIASYAYESGAGDVEIGSVGDGTFGGKVEISCRILEDSSQVILEFKDGGRPFDPLAVPSADIGLSAKERPIGGLGIFMTRKLMDVVEYRYENGKNVLTMRKSWG